MAAGGAGTLSLLNATTISLNQCGGDVTADSGYYLEPFFGGRYCGAGVWNPGTFHASGAASSIADNAPDGCTTLVTPEGQSQTGESRWLDEAVATTCTGGTILVPGGEYATGGEITLSRNVTITGRVRDAATGNDPVTARASMSVLVGNGAARVLHVLPFVQVTLRGVYITGGKATGNGGGILNEGALVTDSIIVDGNQATGRGGGIMNAYLVPLTMTSTQWSFVSHNTAFDGGGIATEGPVTMTDVAVFGNSAGHRGGGIYAEGEAANVTIHGTPGAKRSLISSNTASDTTAPGVIIGGGGAWVSGECGNWAPCNSTGHLRINDTLVAGNLAECAMAVDDTTGAWRLVAASLRSARSTSSAPRCSTTWPPSRTTWPPEPRAVACGSWTPTDRRSTGPW